MAATLPLTVFEQYMLDDDSAEHPMVFYLRTRFQGQLDRPRFEAALTQALERHPLLRSVLHEVAGQTNWLPLDRVQPTIVWNRRDRQAAGPRTASRLDLHQQPGLRVWVETTATATVVLWELHHACTDGTGGMQLIEDTLLAYASLSESTAVAPNWRPLVDADLTYRKYFGLSGLARIARWPLNLLASFGVAQFFANRPVPLAFDLSQTPSFDQPPSPAPATETRRLTAAELRHLHAAAAEQGVTVNDLLLRDLLTTLDAWQAEHAPEQAKPCVRISVPVNLRADRSVAMPAANIVSMVFMDRRPRRYRPSLLLAALHLDTWFIKRLRLGLVFIALLQVFARLTGGMKWLLSSRRCLATAVLSNLGVQFDRLPLPYRRGRAVCGDVELAQVELLPPVRPQTRAAVGVVTYGGELTLAMHYDDRCLSAPAAASLLDRFVASLQTSAATWPALKAHPAATPATSSVLAPAA